MSATPLSPDEVREVQSQLRALGEGVGPDYDPTWLQDKVETLLRGSTFVYVAEGRANAVYRMIFPPSEDEEQAAAADGADADADADAPPAPRDDPEAWRRHPLAGYLLRVPKVVAGAAPHGYGELQRYRTAVVEPRVGARFLVPQLLVRLAAPQHGAALNAERAAHGAGRDPGSAVGGNEAFLIEDLSPLPWRDDLGLEFKPKWLAQSPIAPVGATRCRTCAREAWRNHEKLEELEASGGEHKSKKKKPITPPVCPLGLVHADPDVVRGTLRALTPSDGWSDADRERLRAALGRTQVLARLRDLQCAGDAGNAMFDCPQDDDFGLAMTLRDCTCFVRMPRVAAGAGAEDGNNNDEEEEVEIRFADVDRKNWESKAEYWQHSHTNLVEKGYYHGTEEPPMETHCLLSGVVAE
jgi:inositol-pentakisphosphate 2-kinase